MKIYSCRFDQSLHRGCLSKHAFSSFGSFVWYARSCIHLVTTLCINISFSYESTAKVCVHSFCVCTSVFAKSTCEESTFAESTCEGSTFAESTCEHRRREYILHAYDSIYGCMGINTHTHTHTHTYTHTHTHTQSTIFDP